MPVKPEKLSIEAVRCKGCELCVVVCRRGAIKMADKLDERGERVVEHAASGPCDRCGRCVLVCPDGAIGFAAE